MTDEPGSAPDDALPYLWTADHAVLIQLVRQLESQGRERADMAEIRAAVGIGEDEMHRVISRLDRGNMIDLAGGGGLAGMRSGVYLVRAVTERGLRAAGAWPSEAETLASQLIAAFTEAAETEPDPEEKSKLRTAAASLGAIGQKTVTEIVASYLAKASGA